MKIYDKAVLFDWYGLDKLVNQWFREDFLAKFLAPYSNGLDNWTVEAARDDTDWNIAVCLKIRAGSPAVQLFKEKFNALYEKYDTENDYDFESDFSVSEEGDLEIVALEFPTSISNKIFSEFPGCDEFVVKQAIATGEYGVYFLGHGEMGGIYTMLDRLNELGLPTDEKTLEHGVTLTLSNGQTISIWRHARYEGTGDVWAWKVDTQYFDSSASAWKYLNRCIQEKLTGQRVLLKKYNAPDICGIDGSACRSPEKRNTALCQNCPVAEKFRAEQDGVEVVYAVEGGVENV